MIYSQQEEYMEFQYKVIEKQDYIFITLKGKMSKESKDQLKTCLAESLSSSAKTAVLILKDINSIDLSMNRDFTLFQHELRNSNKTIFLVGLKSLLKEDLVSRGLLRNHEVKNNLEDIIEIAK